MCACMCTCTHTCTLIILQHAANAAHPPLASRSSAFVDAEYSFPWFVTSFARMRLFFGHAAFNGHAFKGQEELVDIMRDIDDRFVASARVWIEKYILATMIENVRRNIDTDDWSDSGTGTSLGVVMLVNEACAHLSNFAEILSKMNASEAVAAVLCERLVAVIFSAINQYCKQLLRPLRDVLRTNVAAITGRSSPGHGDAEAHSKAEPHALGEIITSEVMVVLNNFLYLRGKLDYIMQQSTDSCLRKASQQPFVDSHQDMLVHAQHKQKRQLNFALLMVTDAAAQCCVTPACTLAGCSSIVFL